MSTERVVPSVLQRLRATDIIRMAGLTAASLGQEYYRIGAVRSTQRQGMRIAGVVDVPHTSRSPVQTANTATSEPSLDSVTPNSIAYPVDLEIQSVTQWENRCPCGQHPPLVPTICPHAAALLYQWLARPMVFVTDVPPLEIPLHARSESVPQTGETASHLTRPLGIARSAQLQHGPAPLVNLAEILTQTGLSELRNIAREYEIAPNGMNKQQLADAILEELRRPEAVRKVATTLEKAQRQLLAALTLAGGSMTDEDLRGLFERFNLGQPNQLQNVLLALQGKALLFRTSLNSSSQQRIGLNGMLLDVGWYVPMEVRNALHVSTPVTLFDVSDAENGIETIQEAEPYDLQATLLLVARTLDGSQTSGEMHTKEERFAHVRPAGTYTPRTTGPMTTDGSLALPPPNDFVAPSLIAVAQKSHSLPEPLLRFAIRLLRLSDILHRDDKGTAHLRILANAAQLLLGPTHSEVLRDLFELWLSHASYDELFALTEEGLRLRCRAISLNHPVLRAGELEAENSEARQSLIALLAQAPVGQWIHFPAFARFVYRINPLFLQKRQRLYASPHWWIEQEEGHPLQPTKWNDWSRAELRYLSRLVEGPLHWWGVCDVAHAHDGRLLAFRLTPFADWLLNGEEQVEPTRIQNEKALSDVITIPTMQDALVACSVDTWSIIQIMEAFTESAHTEQGRLRYRITPKGVSAALGEGRQPTALLELLSTLAKQTSTSSDSPLSSLLAQLERWVAGYGRIRIYTGVDVLETADTIVMRELSATTGIDEQIIQTIHPTLRILKKSGAEQIIDELRRRGQLPLLHNED
jgi:hypothetical protein